jgi:hypothetical protein
MSTNPTRLEITDVYEVTGPELPGQTGQTGFEKTWTTVDKTLTPIQADIVKRHHPGTHFLLAGEAILPSMPGKKVRVLIVAADDNTEKVAKEALQGGT